MIFNKKGLISIDILRALAAMSVFLYHQHVGHLLSVFTKFRIFEFIDGFGALYAVPLFFLVSGYCIHLSNLKYIKLSQSLPLKSYFKQRFLRIYPPYLLAVLVAIGISALTQYVPTPTFKDFLIHLLCLQGFTVAYFNNINVVLWTITIEVAFYIIYPLFYYLRLKFSLNYALTFTFIISLLSIIYFSVQTNISTAQYYCVFNIWFSWCTGAFIADKLFFDVFAFKSLAFKMIYFFIVLFSLILIIYPINSLSIFEYQLKILIWTGPLIFMLSKEGWFAKKNALIVGIIVNIGLSSYSLYLLHEPLIFLKNYLAATYLPSYLQKVVEILGIFIIPFICWLNYRYVEQPFIKKKQIVN